MSMGLLKSLRFRLTAGGILTLLVLFALVHLNTFRVMHSFALEVAEADIDQTSIALTFVLQQQALPGDTQVLSEYFNRLVQAENSQVLYIALKDAGGGLIGASDGAPDPLPTFGEQNFLRPNHEEIHVALPVGYAGNQSGTVYYGMSTRLTERATYYLFEQNILVQGLGLLVVMLALLFIGLRLGKRLNRLVVVSQAFAAGNFQTRAPQSGDDEISHLARSLNHMADAVTERNAALHESKAQLDAMLNNPSLMIGLVEPQGNVRAMNKAVLALRSNNIDEIIGIPLWEMDVFRHDADVQRRIREAVERAAAGEGSLFDITISTVWGIRAAEFSLQPVKNDAGEVTWLVPRGIDITDRLSARNALHTSRERLRKTLEFSPNIAVQWFDRRGRVIYWNGASERLYGWASQEAVGKTLEELAYPPAEVDAFHRTLERIARTGEVVGPVENASRHRSGESRWVEATVFSIPGDSQDEPIVVCMDVDITSRKMAQEALERERAFLSTLIRTIPDMIWLKDPDGVYLSCNPRFEQFFGASESEIVGKTDYDFVDKELADSFRAHDLTAMREGAASINEEWITCAIDGHRELVETTKTPMRDAQGRLIGVLGVAHDITARNRMQVELREKDERFRALFDLSADAAFIVDEGRFVECNQAAVALFGYDSKQAFLNKTPFDVSPPRQPDGEASYRKVEQVLETAHNEGVNRFEWVHLRADGSAFHAEVTLSEFTLRGKQVVHATVRDISDRKRAEAEIESYRENLEDLVKRRTGELHESQRQLSTIIEHIPAVFVVKDIEGRYQLVNRRFEEAVGLTREQIIGHTDRKVLRSELAEVIMAKDQEVLAGSESVAFEHAAQHPDGSQHTYLTTKVPMPDETGKNIALIGISTDITQVKTLRDELAKAQAIAHVGSWRVDLLTDELTWSDETYRIFGVEPGAPLNIDGFMQRVFPQDRRNVELAWSLALSGEPYDVDHRITVGNEVRWVREQAEVQFDTGGRPVASVGSVQDITDIKRAQDATQQALTEAQHLARAKSEFLANMSHEIRTPLNAVLGVARIGMREDKGRKSFDLWQRVSGAGEHLLGVINDILDYSKIESGKFSVELAPFQLRRTIDSIVDAVSDIAAQKGLQFVTERDPVLPEWVLGDAQRLQQILLNLVSNGIKFTEQGTVSLRVICEGDDVKLVVSDTGIGMNAAHIDRLFKPFEQADTSFTRRYGGTGLGLVISRDLVQMMGGEIKVKSELGAGSTFSVRLPLPEVDAPMQDPADAARDVGSRLNGVRILAAEDVEANRFILEDLLDCEGAVVTFAHDGQQAVDLLTEKGASAFDVVLMDVQMPVMDGYEATCRIASAAPQLPVIGLTAHALDEARQHCHAAGMKAHVAKPVDADALVGAILEFVQPPEGAGSAIAIAQPEGERSLSRHPADAEEPVDWAALTARFNRREAFVAKLVDKAIESVREKPGKLREAASVDDYESLAFVAHALKGVAGNLMANGVFEMAKSTEMAARAGEPGAIESAHELAGKIDELLAALERRSSLLHQHRQASAAVVGEVGNG